MSRGAKLLTVGVLLVIAGLVVGQLIKSAAIPPMIVNVALYGGILAAILGIVLWIVDRGKNDAQSTRGDAPPPAGTRLIEKENQRMREELSRRRQGGK